MSDTATTPSSTAAMAASCRPYHHGDLRRGLIEAAQTVLERDGPQALSLRAVAREAGVSPAAPYHHFKDKSELLVAVAGEGFSALHAAMSEAVQADPARNLISMGLAYVKFARAHPALYRAMYDSSRNEDGMPENAHEKENSGFQLVRDALARTGADPNDETGLELACIAAWCSAHGLAEMAGFKQFKPMIDRLGGEDAFMLGVLEHLFISKSVAPKG